MLTATGNGHRSGRGPAERALREYLRAHRQRLPRVLRRSLAAGLAAFAGYGAVLAALSVTAPHLFVVLAPYLLLVLAGGREPAMLMAYQALSGAALPWVALVAVIGDAGMVLVGVPFYWWALQRLRSFPVMRAILLSIERRAAANRHVIDRWGPPGLALVVAVPAWGTGVVVAGALGLIARMDVRRLIGTLLLTVVVVNTGWAIVLARASDFIPDAGLVSYAPAGLIALLATGAIVTAVRDQRRGVVALPLDGREHLDADRLATLHDLGIRRVGGALLVDCARLREGLDVPDARPEQCRSVSELLCLPTVEPMDALALSRVGVFTIRDLAIAPPALVADAIAEVAKARPGEPLVQRAGTWHAAAEAWADAGPVPAR